MNKSYRVQVRQVQETYVWVEVEAGSEAEALVRMQGRVMPAITLNWPPKRV